MSTFPRAAPTASSLLRAVGSAAGVCSSRRQADVRLRVLQSGWGHVSGQKKYKTRIGGAETLTPGKHTIAFDFAYDGGGMGKGGTGTLAVDGTKVAKGRIEFTQPIRFSLDESFDVGQDTGTPVIDEYDSKMPFKFAGTLNKVEIDLGAEELTPRSAANSSDSSGTLRYGCSEGWGAVCGQWAIPIQKGANQNGE